MKIYISILLLAVVLLWTNPVTGKVYLTKEDALKQAFPNADRVERQTLFLNDEDIKLVQGISKAKVESKLFIYYTAREKDSIIGYAVFESHIVRTKPEIFMAVINLKGAIDYIEILAFYEPEEYLPPKRWLQLFKGRRLDDQFRVKRGISAISGATLTAEGITREIRRILAVFELMVLKK